MLVRKFGVRSEAAVGSSLKSAKRPNTAVMLPVRLPPEMFYRLKARAATHNVALAVVIRDALERHLNVGN